MRAGMFVRDGRKKKKWNVYKEGKEEEKEEQVIPLYSPSTALAQEGASRVHSSPGLLCSSDTQPYNDQAP